ncbi:MAG: 1-deoxy-D-xylulose-5-phosphate reductoisomerase [Desulfobacteraceae bacterium]|nr:1-deoxy-D-xylulose-5-phosphate reductoisomerase [Desulfobacteraceae bacterium]
MAELIKNIAILGSTGSIGRNVLEVVRQYPGRFRVLGLAAGRNLALLKEQIEAFRPELVSVASETELAELRRLLARDWHHRLVCGQRGAERVAALDGVEMVVSAIVGAAGLPPTVAAIQAGKDIALANKETLVMAGPLIMEAVSRMQVALLPVDSEHNAIFQALAAGRREDVRRLVLTASGGPFRERASADLWEVTPEQALRHPNWSMGAKISIDSATLMNKGLEVIEAHFLFGVPLERIEVLVHPQSVVHSLVEYIDGSLISQMGVADMRIPIAYALAYPERLRLNLPPLNLINQPMTFAAPDFKKFPCLKLAYQAGRQGGLMPAIMNAANEVAVAAFLSRRLRFPEIALCVAETMTRVANGEAVNLTAILEADLAARVQAESVVSALSMSARQKRGEPLPCPDLPPGHPPLP